MTLLNQIPLCPPFSKGKKLNAFLDSPQHDKFPSLQKHALSLVKGAVRGDLCSQCN
jgi:hypothetical protein